MSDPVSWTSPTGERVWASASARRRKACARAQGDNATNAHTIPLAKTLLGCRLNVDLCKKRLER